MRTIRIGIFDEEESYAGKMSAYLNRMGKGKWNAVAFTDEEAMEKYVEKRHLHILAGTDIEVLRNQKKRHKDTHIIWLREKEIPLKDNNTDIVSVCRYAGAKTIGETIGETAARLLTDTKSQKPLVAVYSPIGRCGKTALALHIVRNERFGKWLYIGMEDYGFLEGKADSTGLDHISSDNFLYYVKERNQEKLHFLFNSEQRIIPSAFSPFDTKQINEADLKWLFAILQQMEMYSGIIFDIGTGILQNLEWLVLFDYILVPFLPEEGSMGKMEHFKDLVAAHDLEGLREKMEFLNMGDKSGVEEKIEEIGLRRWSG